MIARLLEPEVMNTPQEAGDYDGMDHAEVNRVFVDDLLRAMRGGWSSVLDVGTGTARIPIELCRREDFEGHIVAVDLAEEMLKQGRRNVTEAGVGERVRIDLVDAKSLPYADAAFDVVMSNSIVHHIPEPADVLREMVRVLKPGGLLFVRDLLRPESEADVERIVAAYAGTETAQAQQLFRQSLWAALTVGEMQQLAVALSLPPICVLPTSDRHWTLAY